MFKKKLQEHDKIALRGAGGLLAGVFAMTAMAFVVVKQPEQNTPAQNAQVTNDMDADQMRAQITQARNYLQGLRDAEAREKAAYEDGTAKGNESKLNNDIAQNVIGYRATEVSFTAQLIQSDRLSESTATTLAHDFRNATGAGLQDLPNPAVLRFRDECAANTNVDAALACMTQKRSDNDSTLLQAGFLTALAGGYGTAWLVTGAIPFAPPRRRKNDKPDEKPGLKL